MKWVKSFLAAMFLIIALTLLVVGVLAVVDEFTQVEPQVECIEGLFMEQLKPDVETFGAFQGYICGENLDYVWGTPPGPILNSGLSVEDFN